MKRSSIEYLMDNIYLIYSQKWNDIIQIAQEMHKNEIIDAHIEGQREFDDYPHTQWTTDQAEDYYKRVFTE